MYKIPTIEEMLKAGMHFGHRTSKRHPKMEPFIFGSKNGLSILDLAKAQKMLVKALAYLSDSIAAGKTVLLVGTKDQVKKEIKKIAIENDLP
jgi:small subunit ribosomal protein S2